MEEDNKTEKKITSSSIGAISYRIAVGLATTLVLCASVAVLTRLRILARPSDRALEIITWLTLVCLAVYLVGLFLALVTLLKRGTTKTLARRGLLIYTSLLVFVASVILWQSLSKQVYGAQILEYGLYRREPAKSSEATDSVQATPTALLSASLVAETDTIPMSLGGSFGLKYTVLGSPYGSDATLRIVYQYPRPGMRDSILGRFLDSTSYKVAKSIGDTMYTAFTFEHEWEMVPGTWAINIWHENRRLARIEFYCVR
jgi:hypothetical protein